MRWGNETRREQLRSWYKRLRSIRTWQLVVLLLLSLLVTATMFRLNSLAMADLRKAVVTADEKGDNAVIASAVNALGAYVSTHMNTDLGDGFYLTSSYDRARQAALQVASDTPNAESKLYQQASVQCQTERLKVAGGYVQCVLNKVSELGGPSTIVSELSLPRIETYKVDFVSPFWSPDGAGISAAVSTALALIIVGRLTGVIVLRFLLKRHSQSIS